MDLSSKGSEEIDDGCILDKAQVLQEAKKCFTTTSIKTNKLIDALAKCVFVILTGEPLAQSEATDLFFHISRLFQYKDKDGIIRKLIYIGIRALSKRADNVYVVTPSLTTDVNSSKNHPTIRASAFRALCQISGLSSLTIIDRYLKQSIVDKSPLESSAALISLIHLATTNNEVVNKCMNEVQDALRSELPMVQFHALGLRYNSCKHDKLSTSLLISECISISLESPLAICLLIRIIVVYMNSHEKNEISDESCAYLDYINRQLKHKSNLVEYEAANAIVNLIKPLKENDKRSAIGQLRTFLTSSNSALRFSAIRSLNELTMSSSTSDIRFWSIHRIGGVCKLHLLNKRYKIGDHIIGILDFTNSSVACAKYTVILQCEETQQYELKQEFSIGLKKNDFIITIPSSIVRITEEPVLHCVLSFLFYITDKNYAKTLFEDKVGTIELGPNELDTKLFSCDFPIIIHS